ACRRFDHPAPRAETPAPYAGRRHRPARRLPGRRRVARRLHPTPPGAPLEPAARAGPHGRPRRRSILFLLSPVGPGARLSLWGALPATGRHGRPPGRGIASAFAESPRGQTRQGRVFGLGDPVTPFSEMESNMGVTS